MADTTTDDSGACSVHGAIVCEMCAVTLRDAEWRAAAERVRDYYTNIPRTDYATGYHEACGALLAAMQEGK